MQILLCLFVTLSRQSLSFCSTLMISSSLAVTPTISSAWLISCIFYLKWRTLASFITFWVLKSATHQMSCSSLRPNIPRICSLGHLWSTANQLGLPALTYKASHSLSSSPSMQGPSLYRSIADALQYLTLTRPYLTFPVNLTCQYMHNPSDESLKM